MKDAWRSSNRNDWTLVIRSALAGQDPIFSVGCLMPGPFLLLTPTVRKPVHGPIARGECDSGASGTPKRGDTVGGYGPGAPRWPRMVTPVGRHVLDPYAEMVLAVMVPWTVTQWEDMRVISRRSPRAKLVKLPTTNNQPTTKGPTMNPAFPQVHEVSGHGLVARDLITDAIVWKAVPCHDSRRA